ncbi:uncharacterized protein LAJ45_11760 [Morchella importuna]|uniref:uncharacterized protein n=1 Tax=Morchella importuna TaxID=1174673 RepID=UPI001E8D9E4E|nr:uncharacterized protein LAJ45_11760 [Morchella importuna]KAH8144276.1 hypothetical protein LAJ45_11760 [Morchella importuna]
MNPLNEPSFIGILTKITFPELCNLILKHTAPGRAVRTIWGAIENVPPAAVPPFGGGGTNYRFRGARRLVEEQQCQASEDIGVLHRAGAGANLGGAESPR